MPTNPTILAIDPIIMGRSVEFFVPLEVKAKQSMRTRVVVPKDGGKPFTQNHKDPEVVKNENNLAALMVPNLPDAPLVGPLFVRYCFESHYRRNEKRKLVNNAVTLPKHTKPDYTNLAKNLDDVLEALGFFANDAQIATALIEKRWTFRVGVQVFIGELDPDRK